VEPHGSTVQPTRSAVPAIGNPPPVPNGKRNKSLRRLITITQMTAEDGLQILTSNEQWLKEAIKKKNVEATDKAAFATRISQAVRHEKAHEDVRAEAKLERQKKVVKDRAIKTERQEGVQGGFGHDPRNAPAFFQWREIEIWFMEEGVQMYRFHNSSRAEKINLSDSLPDINTFVRQYVRRYDKWRNKSNSYRDMVEDFSFDAYIAYQSGNSTPFEVLFTCSPTTTWADFLKEFDSIKAKKDKPKLILAFPTKVAEPEPPKRSTISIPRPNNKRSRSRLRGTSDESGEEGVESISEQGVKPEQGLCVKSEPQEAAETADEPENGDSDSSGAGSVKPENPDDPNDSGDNYGDAPDADEVETEADSPPPTSNNKSGRKRGLSGRFE
jgi:hypothetical protein